MRPAIFLDRDGVIIENRANYVRSWADVQIFDQAKLALVRMRRTDYRIVVVTNQSPVGRGLISEQTARSINEQLVEEIVAAGGRIDGAFMCPHAPWEGCDCRKPEPGLFLQAANELSINLGSSLMIGDALSDLIAARAAGINRVGLVLTGRGREQGELPDNQLLQPYEKYETLNDAVTGMLGLAPVNSR